MIPESCSLGVCQAEGVGILGSMRCVGGHSGSWSWGVGWCTLCLPLAAESSEATVHWPVPRGPRPPASVVLWPKLSAVVCAWRHCACSGLGDTQAQKPLSGPHGHTGGVWGCTLSPSWNLHPPAPPQLHPLSHHHGCLWRGPGRAAGPLCTLASCPQGLPVGHWASSPIEGRLDHILCLNTGLVSVLWPPSPALLWALLSLVLGAHADSSLENVAFNGGPWAPPAGSVRGLEGVDTHSHVCTHVHCALASSLWA